MIGALNVRKLRLDLGEYLVSMQAVFVRRRGGVPLGPVDLDVKRGAACALVGPAGSGKSLTLACLSGDVKPARGSVRYFGYEIGGLAPDRLTRMGIARAAQTPRGFGPLTVLETVTAAALLRRGRLTSARTYAADLLSAAELGDSAALTFGALDAAARRRLELVRALATEPQLLLLDDIGAGLGDEERAGLGAIVAALRKPGCTIVAAARDARELAVAVDTLVTIESGKTAEGVPCGC